jgi:ComF family protein
LLAGIWRSVARLAGELVFPRTCVVCARLQPMGDQVLVCAGCLTSLRPLPIGRCARCGHPGHGGTACTTCAGLDPAIVSARSFCWADDRVARECLHAFKYDGWHALATVLASRMRTLWADEAPSALVPVPLAAGRRRERGYNQAELLARALARLWTSSIVADVLDRTRETPSQTQLTRAHRFANVADAFRVSATRAHSLHGRHIILIDDVMTTGATLNACAVALRGAGIPVIHCVTFGRARAPGHATPA